jgi:hypothetical protein
MFSNVVVQAVVSTVCREFCDLQTVTLARFNIGSLMMVQVDRNM